MKICPKCQFVRVSEARMGASFGVSFWGRDLVLLNDLSNDEIASQALNPALNFVHFVSNPPRAEETVSRAKEREEK